MHGFCSNRLKWHKVTNLTLFSTCLKEITTLRVRFLAWTQEQNQLLVWTYRRNSISPLTINLTPTTSALSGQCSFALLHLISVKAEAFKVTVKDTLTSATVLPHTGTRDKDTVKYKYTRLPLSTEAQWEPKATYCPYVPKGHCSSSGKPWLFFFPRDEQSHSSLLCTTVFQTASYLNVWQATALPAACMMARKHKSTASVTNCMDIWCMLQRWEFRHSNRVCWRVQRSREQKRSLWSISPLHWPQAVTGQETLLSALPLTVRPFPCHISAANPRAASSPAK